ncbi:MAG: hypothetical protein A3I43_00920 [Omnitrophica WOR_2 bacterium RIFCSPLOWO2_02_FULL_50_19]|nr:MAG: hypothetical protein A3I43_00920 [Omnitrophica WOR_2 bacterium RIFCSPLOWO2_02_FULL_50_19]
MLFYEEVLRAFQKEKARYVIVGGVAANLIGLMRSTADLDILVEMSDNNLKKIVNILKKRGYQIKQPIDPIGIANKKTREDWIRNKHLKALNFYKKNGFEEVDIIIDSPVTFEKAKKSTSVIKTDDIALPVISIDNLIKMKEKTGREVDRFDVKELKAIKRLRKKL